MSEIAEECPECGGIGEVGSLGTRRKCDHQYLREKKIAEIREKSEIGNVVYVHENTVHDLMADIRFLLSELAEEKRHGALGWEQSNKWLDENGRLRSELDQAKKELGERISLADVGKLTKELASLRTELAEKDKTLEWIRDAGTDYQSINKAREVLLRFKKGDTKDA